MIAILTAMRTPGVPILPPVQPTPQVPPQPPRAVQTEAATSQVTGNVTNPASRIVVSTTTEIPEAGKKDQREKETKIDSKIESIKEKVRGLQGIDTYGNFANLCFFPNLKPPPKFRTPDFVKSFEPYLRRHWLPFYPSQNLLWRDVYVWR